MTNNPFDSQEFRREFEETLDKKLQPIIDLKSQVEDHEKAIQRSRGAMWILGGLWALLVSLLSGHIWFGRKP